MVKLVNSGRGGDSRGTFLDGGHDTVLIDGGGSRVGTAPGERRIGGIRGQNSGDYRRGLPFGQGNLVRIQGDRRDDDFFGLAGNDQHSCQTAGEGKGELFHIHLNEFLSTNIAFSSAKGMRSARDTFRGRNSEQFGENADTKGTEQPFRAFRGKLKLSADA